MTETELIQWLAKKYPIGDDCSIFTWGNKEILVTCDALVEEVHFRAEWASWRHWGKKAAGAALSDIAAMGGRPKFCWVHLSLPKNFPVQKIKDFYRGLQSVLGKFKVTVAGGNISRSPKGFSAVLTILGERPKGVKMLRRDAKAGDKVYVAGTVGLAGMVVVPKPQIELGLWLAKNKIANACIDVSDGLLQDLNHIAQASKVKMVIEANRIPHAGSFKSAVTKGEDYVLAFTVPPAKVKRLKRKRVLTLIGRVVKGKPALEVLNTKGKRIPFTKMGYQHI